MRDVIDMCSQFPLRDLFLNELEASNLKRICIFLYSSHQSYSMFFIALWETLIILQKNHLLYFPHGRSLATFISTSGGTSDTLIQVAFNGIMTIILL